MPDELLLTLDAGTTGLKCTLFAADGTPVAAAVSPYGVDFPSPGWAQQPAEQIIGAAIDGARQVLACAPGARVAAIGLSGTMNGCLPLDRAGVPLHPNIIHSDVRAEAQLARIAEVLPMAEYYKRTGNRLDTHYMLPKLLWLREHRPDVFRQAACFVNTKDALYGFLTGQPFVTDYSDASLTGALDIHHGRWDAELLAALGVDPATMPELRPSHDVTGRLTADAASRIGLPEGTPVSVGGGDGACASHGAGLFAPGGAYCNIGSSAWMCSLADVPVIDPEMRVFNYLDIDGRHVNVCATVQTAGAALDWAAEQLFGCPPDAQTFDMLEALAETASPGSDGVFFLPTLMGERTPWWDPNARGALIGQTLYHTRAQIARAAYEGVAQALHLCDSALRDRGLAYPFVLLVGGGTQSRLWPQMLADMFVLPTRVHRQPRQATSLGAAMAAGVGVGMFSDYEAASRMAAFGPAIEPDPAKARAYARHYDVYRTLYGKIREAYDTIATYQAQEKAAEC